MTLTLHIGITVVSVKLICLKELSFFFVKNRRQVYRLGSSTVTKNCKVDHRNLSKLTRACTLGPLLVVSSDKLGVHTFVRSIPQGSAPVSVPIHICSCSTPAYVYVKIFNGQMVQKIQQFLSQFPSLSFFLQRRMETGPLSLSLSLAFCV